MAAVEAPGPRPIRVAVCDDHPVVRSGLRRILEEETDIEVVGEAGTIEEAIAATRNQCPDVFVMDLELPGGSGVRATQEIRATRPETKVLILTVHDDPAYLRDAFNVGAFGYLVKDVADIELVLAVRKVASGQRYVHPSLGAALLGSNGELDESPKPLSDREVVILRLIALGYTNPQIAAELHLSVRTVEGHRAHIQQKLGLRSRLELVRYCRENGLLSDGGFAQHSG